MTRVVLAACVAALLSAFQPVLAEDDCRLTIVASLPMTMDQSGRISVPFTVGGHELAMMVDTGAPFSTLTESAVRQLALEKRRVTTPVRFEMYGGERLIDYVKVKDAKLAKSDVPAAEFLVMSDRGGPGISGLLGADFISRFDVDFDFAKAKLNLFLPHPCAGRAVYWTQDEAKIAKIDIEYESNHDHHIKLPIQIDGKRVTAILDTGASHTTMNLQMATSWFGVDVNSPGMRMVGSPARPVYVYHFKTLDFEGVTVSNPEVDLVPEEHSHFPGYEALLGTTILRQLHLFIAYKEHKLYVTAADAQ